MTRTSEVCIAPCRSGLVSRKGCTAAPAISAFMQQFGGRYAALSRHKAAPTDTALFSRFGAVPVGAGMPANTGAAGDITPR
ncbi:hypothetical protein CXG50_26710 [Pseudomonas plecoglossicida]|uniref:Diguanylate cyclase n=1 Tax=Pseudomonas plecoglossicida TaxID=70775 RepID=A0ABX4U878_PSEDL|nr:hypothetical protein CSW00_21110 [Pseudomonas sp. MR 02]PLP90435.1 hypothetical protein CX682_15745 [Pseudomonas sp. FFUP_PS_41]PLU84432.1 hypothetical protein CXG44_26270 [Pseudomonas plecoglossicida]TXI03416.1 MAG: hypothetical protein E6Q70_15780 [Pseudomonas monteilii]PLU91004.1 hypothetical protein CXG45_21255 [Pseudomonas plecoglossicida]